MNQVDSHPQLQPATKPAAQDHPEASATQADLTCMDVDPAAGGWMSQVSHWTMCWRLKIDGRGRMVFSPAATPIKYSDLLADLACVYVDREAARGRDN